MLGVSSVKRTAEQTAKVFDEDSTSMATYPDFISLKEAFFELIIKHMHSFRRQKLLNDMLKILTAFVITARSKKSRTACRNMICDQLTNEMDEAPTKRL